MTGIVQRAKNFWCHRYVTHSQGQHFQKLFKYFFDIKMLSCQNLLNVSLNFLAPLVLTNRVAYDYMLTGALDLIL